MVALRSRLDAQLLTAIGRADAVQEWQAEGFSGPQAWLVHNGSQSRADAARLARDARRLRDNPMTADAVGRIGIARACLLLRAATGRTELAFRGDEQRLIDQAATLTVDDTARMVSRWREAADPDGAEPADDLGTVRMGRTIDGIVQIDAALNGPDAWFVHGAVNQVADEIWRCEQSCDDGEPGRTAGQRRAVALVQIIKQGMSADPYQPALPSR